MKPGQIADPHNKNYSPQYDQWLFIVISVVAVILFLLIANPAQFYFLNDDFGLIPISAQGKFIRGYFFRPAFNFSLWADHSIWHKNAFGYHLTNTIIHLANTALLFFFAKKLFSLYSNDKHRFLKSWLVSLFFLLYAFHAEPVFWVAGRGGSLSTLFFLVASIFYLKRDLSKLYLLLSVLSFCIGLLVYESVWIFPVFCFFISLADVRLNRKNWKPEAVCLLMVFISFLVYLFIRRLITGRLDSEYELGELLRLNIPALAHNYNALVARIFLPPMKSSGLFLSIYILLVVLLIALIIATIKKRKFNALVCILIASCLIAVLPPVSLGINTHETESERYIYLPSLFFILLTIEILSNLANKKTLVISCVILIVSHAFYLSHSASAYRFSGSIVRESLNFINERPATGTLYAINVPRQYRGAYMFNSGFNSALKWVCNQCNNKPASIISGYTFQEEKKNYQYTESDIKNVASLIAGFSFSDTTSSVWKLNFAGKSFPFAKNQDKILFWSDSAMIILR